ncbi:hypothetical protein P7C71_g2344, partial [Lecanoromycetidae sp. Uapishka_2]
MVSFWPWKGDDNSPASFEKILSTLSAKISTATGKLDSLRQRSRRLSALWTLSAGFAYLLYTIVLVLVVGWREWGPTEFSAIAAGPTMLVNGQAPPGVLRLEDLGRWRCASCGTMNGEDAEAKKIIASISKHSPIEAGHSGKERADSPGLDIRDKRHDPTYMAAGDEDEGDITQYSDGSSDQDHEVKETKKKATETIEESDTPKRRSTRARKGGKKSG